MERAFNLIDEPWICVRTADCRVQEVSLRDALLQAHQYRELAGETKAQDFAVLRLLLAVLYTTFSRYGLTGEDISFAQNRKLPKVQWKSMWQSGYIPTAPIERYLNEWHDRFWLFDEEHPFYQSNEVKGKSKPIHTGKMIGTLFESANKKRLFSERQEQGRDLGFAEAARWLLHLNCFDDIAAKQPTPKRTWVGKLGLIARKGKNLFETLMLNYCAEQDGKEGIFTSSPTWEQDNNTTGFNRVIAVPDNQAALLTMQSRRIFLIRENDLVTGYYLSGGDYFEEEELFHTELMTLWRGFQEKNEPYHFKPRLYNPTKLLWQEFGSIAVLKEANSEKTKAPGVILRMNELISSGVLDKKMLVTVSAASVIYDYKQATSLPVIDTISDTLTFHAQLLQDVGYECRVMILSEIDKCEEAAKAVYWLYKQLQNACGRRDKDGKTEQSGEVNAKAQFYERIDRPFRLWLARLDPESTDEDYRAQLEHELLEIALRLGDEFAAQAGSAAIFGRYLKPDKEKGNGEITSSAAALNAFSYKLSNQIFTKAGEQS